jgi:hypothetical protein
MVAIKHIPGIIVACHPGNLSGRQGKIQILFAYPPGAAVGRMISEVFYRRIPGYRQEQQEIFPMGRYYYISSSNAYFSGQLSRVSQVIRRNFK